MVQIVCTRYKGLRKLAVAIESSAASTCGWSLFEVLSLQRTWFDTVSKILCSVRELFALPDLQDDTGFLDLS